MPARNPLAMLQYPTGLKMMSLISTLITVACAEGYLAPNPRPRMDYTWLLDAASAHCEYKSRPSAEATVISFRTPEIHARTTLRSDLFSAEVRVFEPADLNELLATESERRDHFPSGPAMVYNIVFPIEPVVPGM
ncbi:uncharacterized protein L969DRAFT_85699 [Mixia osmundae IAM 14324]|uniref:uncharacterized protein n=1 Tax=Mixia osmundae (strain CBS 9802 / IAM 14324 / JCM 22182 / KY 12970) TaxID=764103 RepID=UPI0004A5514B|nr:uncharacterized protein L969DRAFT_85699 [Mixia osmundae IAM 14324]KEI40526.1 hypothetical protein L969DRAFT_85699 [Mixia osmundae IAM 14324]